MGSPLTRPVANVYNRTQQWPGSEMDSDKLTTEQAEQMHKSLFRLANYLCRVVKRMERTRFPPDDPLFKSARRAYDAVCSFCVDLHYLSCKSGVGRAPKQTPNNDERVHGPERGDR
jgi:hypothetical protein